MVDVARKKQLRLVTPATVLIEFLLGHVRDRARANRVLNVIEPLPVTQEIAGRAAALLQAVPRQGKRGPSVTDATAAAFAEELGAVATYDVDDFGALAAAGTGFDVYSVSELIGVIKGS